MEQTRNTMTNNINNNIAEILVELTHQLDNKTLDILKTLIDGEIENRIALQKRERIFG